jgi:hypothetical protein
MVNSTLEVSSETEVQIFFLWAAVFDCKSAHYGSDRFCFWEFKFNPIKTQKNSPKKGNERFWVSVNLYGSRECFVLFLVFRK